ncbi:MAG: SCO family protein [Bryobacteraceae bacterium]|nr:SCO family protein [Bryobacteraceae bacterium]
MPPAAQGVSIEQRLDSQIDKSIPFRDETGKPVTLADYLGRRPAILALVYYECPMLCNMVLNGMMGSVKALDFQPGRDYHVVAVSINPKETPEQAAAKKRAYLRRYGREGSEHGWHFLTGDEPSIRKLADTVGFRYRWDEPTKQYVHASGIMVLTPEARLSRYLYGIEYAPRDVKYALMEASESRIGSPVDQLLLYCFHYDPMTGKYGLVIMNALRLGGLLTLSALAVFWMVMALRRHSPEARV